MKIKLLIDGGDMKPGPAIAQQLGPMGVNMGKVISSVNDATKEFKGMKVPVELDVDEKTKDFTIHMSSPPASELLKKELGIDKGSHDHKNLKTGNAAIEDIIKVAKIKFPTMLDKNLKNAVKSILGTSASVGILVENKDPNECIKEVNAGVFDKEITAEKTEVDDEKRSKLNTFYKELKATQDAKLAQQKAVAEKEAEAKEAAKKEATEKPAEKKEEPKKK